MTYERRYFESLGKVMLAEEHLVQNPSGIQAFNNYQQAEHNFASLCMEILEKLMEENPEVLARLK